jgi:hypothetical protein
LLQHYSHTADNLVRYGVQNGIGWSGNRQNILGEALGQIITGSEEDSALIIADDTDQRTDITGAFTTTPTEKVWWCGVSLNPFTEVRPLGWAVQGGIPLISNRYIARIIFKGYRGPRDPNSFDYDFLNYSSYTTSFNPARVECGRLVYNWVDNTVPAWLPNQGITGDPVV